MRWTSKAIALVLILLLVAVSVAGRGPAAEPGVLLGEFELSPARVAAAGNVVVFVLDSPVGPAFVEGRVFDMKATEVTHGSLVARVVRSYCRAPLVSVPAEDDAGGVDRDAYLAGLRNVLGYAQGHPGVRVLANVSLGSYRPDAEERGLIERIAQSGALVMAAAGNDDTREPLYPAAYDGVVAVASATGSGKAPSSNYGPHVALCASGDISFIDYEFLPYERLRREMDARGTSFAAPMVTATLAYILRRRPNMSPREALGLVRATAGPVADEHYERGALGAGLLDVYRAKSLVQPAYRWVHYVLPAGLGLILAALTVFLCVRYMFVGVFVSLLLWLAGVPTAVLLVMGVKRYLEFVGTGYRDAGPIPFVLACSAVVGCGLLVRFNARRMIWACVPAAGLGLVLELAGLAPVLRAFAVAGAALALAVLAAAGVRRLLRRIRDLPSQDTPAEAAALLARVYERSGDERLRRAAVEAVLRFATEGVAEYLERDRVHPRGAAALLEEIKRSAGGREGEPARGDEDTKEEPPEPESRPPWGL